MPVRSPRDTRIPRRPRVAGNMPNGRGRHAVHRWTVSLAPRPSEHQLASQGNSWDVVGTELGIRRRLVTQVRATFGAGLDRDETSGRAFAVRRERKRSNGAYE